MLETGIGITVVLTAILGVVVSVVVTSQTLFTVTQEYLANYATLLALGFSRSQMLVCVMIQSLIVGGAGTLLGSVGFFFASHASARTPLPLETTPLVYTGLIMVSLICSVASSFLSIRAILGLDPVAVFRG